MASSTSFKSLLPSEPLPWRESTSPKLPPGALMDIADDLLCDLFTEWLPIKSVCHLDSALCQKRRRPYFLALLAKKVLLFNREQIRVMTDPYPRDSYTHRPLGLAALNWVLKRGIHLASLHLPFSDTIGSAEWQSIRDAVASLVLNGHLDKLETISLKNCEFITDADLVAVLSKSYSSVKSIDIKYCGLTESAAAHIKRCAKLEAFTPNGNESAADMVEIFQSCRKLRKVDLRDFSDRLTDEVVLSVAEHCHILEHVDLGWCSAVSDVAIRRVAESCPLLQYANLSDTKITDATVVCLCSRCPMLKRLFFGRCYRLTDAAVLAVAEGLPGLTHIDLYHITAITSSAVETLASKCRELEHIDLAYCSNVSDVTLAKIAQHCPKLEELRVYECGAVTAVGLTYIATKCSNLKTVQTNYKDHILQEEEILASLKQLFPYIVWGTY